MAARPSPHARPGPARPGSQSKSPALSPARRHRAALPAAPRLPGAVVRAAGPGPGPGLSQRPSQSRARARPPRRAAAEPAGASAPSPTGAACFAASVLVFQGNGRKRRCRHKTRTGGEADEEHGRRLVTEPRCQASESGSRGDVPSRTPGHGRNAVYVSPLLWERPSAQAHTGLCWVAMEMSIIIIIISSVLGMARFDSLIPAEETSQNPG
ncbi:translation initiation factor IF-2-like [Aquila chrysaetos chrysaetos]|uniref:translation initiation factor IF-2-like n=1 Tax=Aquila chrysaetos chrysaetos TaxID=223781 RepID=UPI001176A5E1|nr:translation initiation factor IF-2-like [Aquila chrysaetos chrysaetos]